MKIRPIVLIVAIVFSMPFTAMADVRPAILFSDNMVIQRQTQAPVWGWADTGEKVTVTGSWGESATTTAGKAGKWNVKLQTPAAGGPYTITFKGNNTVQTKNVFSGDVWLCSGQSNMQFPVSRADNPAEEAANANYPQIRHFMVERTAVLQEASNCKGAWTVCSPDTVSDFSATAYYTGRELHKNLNVPVGLLTSAWGGTCVEAWTPFAEQADDPFALKRKAGMDEKAKDYSPEKAQTRYETQLKSWEKKTAQAKAQKKRTPRPPSLQADPRLNPNYPGNLYNGMIHPLLSFAIKGALWYQGEANAKELAPAEHYRVQLDRMVRSWRKEWGQDFPFYAVQLPNFKEPQVNPVESENIWPVIRESFVHAAQNTPGVFTCSMIDLGEAKNIHPKNKQDVGRRMASTILNKTYGKDTPTTPFMKSFAVEGDRVVVKFDYTGSGLVAKGGMLKGFAIASADKKFVWADAVIERRGGEDCVAVSSKAVANPVAVRYAWADNPDGCSLYSKEGFPASPFRTDSWELTADAVSTSSKRGKDAAKPVSAGQKTTLVSRLQAGEKQTIVTYGTSLTKVGAWPDQLATVLEQNYPGQVTLINSGRGGSNSVWGRKSFDEMVIQKKPDTVFIEFAINDAVASRKVSVAQARENLEYMIDRLLKAHPDCEIILMVMNPPVAHHKNRRPNLTAYNQMYRDVAKEWRFQLIDHYPAWEKILNENPGLFIQYVPDGIHPVREGTLHVIMPTMIQSLGLKQGKPELNERTACWNYLFGMMDKEVKQNKQVTRQEYNRYWEKHFKMQDANKDNLLKPDEYKPSVLFNHVDADNDGTITLEEYHAIYVVHFKKRDANSDGKLDESEIWIVK